MADEPEDKKKEGEEAAPAKKGGGIKAMLPLIVALVGMPVLAYTVTQFVLVPKLIPAMGPGDTSGGGEPGDDHGEDKGGSGDGKGGGHPAGTLESKVQFSKLITNLKDERGRRLLVTSFTAAGKSSKFQTKAEENMDQLTDLALSILGNKSIRDLEKPESRNVIKAELMSQFNAALGNGMVQEIYITELAIQ